MVKKPSRRARVARLRDLMQDATHLSEPVEYFLDHLAEDRKFIRQSQSAVLEPGGLLDAAIHRIAAHLFGPGTQVGGAMLVRYEKLWHGSCALGGRLATVLYHSGIDVGLLAVPAGGQTELVRFTVIRPAPLSSGRIPWLARGGSA